MHIVKSRLFYYSIQNMYKYKVAQVNLDSWSRIDNTYLKYFIKL